MKNGKKTDADIFRSIFESAPDVITITDPSGTVIDVNPRVKEILGYEPEEIIGKNFPRLKFIQLKDVPKLVKLFKNTIRTGKVKPIVKLELKRKGGGSVPVEVWTSFVRENGKVRWVVNVYRDISERKKMEEARRLSPRELEKRVEDRTSELAESEKRYRGLFENATDFVYTTDLRGTFTDVNKAAERLTGYRKKQLIGMNFWDYTPPEDHKKINDAFRGILTTGKPIQDFPLTVIVKAGSKKFFETSVGLLKRRKKIIGFQGISRDVTERMRAERELQLFHELINCSPDYISLIDMDSGRFTYVNKSLCQDLGYTAEEFQSMTVADIDPTVTAFWDPERERERRKKEPVFSRQGTVRRKDGTVFPVEITSSIVTLPDGEFMVAASSNISERKMFEEGLIKASSEWRSTFDAVNDPVCLLDPKGVILRCNNAMKTFLKKSYQEICGRKCCELVHGTSKPVKKCPLAEMKKHLRREMMELPRGDRWFHVTVDPILDEKGKLKGAVHVMSDITERVKNENKLRYLSEIVKQSSDSILCTDPEFKINYINPAATELYGWTLDELKGETPDFLNAEPTAPEIQQRIYKTLASGKSATGEALNRRKDGGTFYCQFKTSPLMNQNGQIMGYIGLQRDITKLKKAEEELRKIQKHLEGTVNALPDLMFEVDAHGRIYNYHTPDSQKLYVPPEKFLNMTIRQVIPKDAADTIMRGITSAAEKGYHGGTTYSLKMPEGLCWFELSISAWGNPKSPEGRFIILVREITERKRVQEELLRSREQLHELTRHLESVREEERGRLGRELHDELGQVLTALKIDVSWLKKRPAAFQNEAISEKIRVMSELIDQTIATTKRISTELRPAMLDDLGLVPAIEWQVDEFNKRSGIVCALSVTPPEIVIDPDISTAVFRILQEALTNILRYAKATRVKISLNATEERIELKVQDNGKGIKREDVLASTSFGLIGMRERLFLSGGTLDINGRKGKGTSVSVVIPLGQSHKIK